MDLPSSSAHPQHPPQFNSDPRYPHGPHHSHPQAYAPYPHQQYDYTAYPQHQQHQQHQQHPQHQQHQQPPPPPPPASYHHHGTGIPDGSANGHPVYTSPPPPPPSVNSAYHHHQFVQPQTAPAFHPPAVQSQHPGHYAAPSVPTSNEHDPNFYPPHVPQTNGGPIPPSYAEPSGIPQLTQSDPYANGHAHHQHSLQPYPNGTHPPPPPPPEPALLPSHGPVPTYQQAPEPHYASGVMPPPPDPFPSGGPPIGGEAPASLDYAQLMSTWQHLASLLQPHARPQTSMDEIINNLPVQLPHQTFKVAIDGLKNFDSGAADRIAKDSPLTAPPKPANMGREKEPNPSDAEDTDSKDKDEQGLGRKKPKGDDKNGADPQQCLTCGARSSPEWRRGPLGPRTLCNACGLVYIKIMKRRANGLPEEDSPTGEDEPAESGYTTSGSH